MILPRLNLSTVDYATSVLTDSIQTSLPIFFGLPYFLFLLVGHSLGVHCPLIILSSVYSTFI